MSGVKRVLVRQLADSIWPGRTVNGYANLIAARLRKLADEACTGMLPVSGRGDGAIFFRAGQVVYAESSRTPLPGPAATGLDAFGLVRGQAHGDVGDGSTAMALAERPAGRLRSLLESTELIIDATTELLTRESRYAKFRHASVLPLGDGRPISVDPLLTEVQRRHEVLRQLAAVLGPDTPVARDPALDLPSAQVSAAQWALLARADDGTTPRDIAMHLGRSVFATTIEAYRLAELGLLIVAGGPTAAASGGWARGTGGALSFIRAVPEERGSDG